MEYIQKKEELTREQRKFFLKSRYIEYSFKDKNGEERVAEYFESLTLKSSDDSMYEGRKSNKPALMYGNSVELIQIAPDDVFADEHHNYCINRENKIFYHVWVMLGNRGFYDTDLWTTNFLEAIEYFSKLENFFELTPKPAVRG